MARYKNAQWALNNPVGSCEEAQIAVLMDIRDELQTLNNVLRCPRFLQIPTTLDRIAVNTRKPKRRSKKKS